MEATETACKPARERFSLGAVARVRAPELVKDNTVETILNRIECSIRAIKALRFLAPLTWVG